jgi:hypothetical protein
MKRKALIAVPVAVVAIALLLALPFSAPAAGGSGKRFYVSRKPALKVELTIYRYHVYRANVSATGICSNGEPSNEIGYGIIGGPGLLIRGRRHRFNKSIVGTTHSMIFRGRVEDNKVVGLFQQMFREESPQEGGKEELPGPQCGSGSSPKGEVIHFTAKRVSEKRVPARMK